MVKKPKSADKPSQEEMEEVEEEESGGKVLRDRAILILAGEIQGGHLGIVQELLHLHYTESFNDHITMLINSPGGSTDIGWAIVDVMNFIRLPVHTVCIGMAASMAADIFANGDHRVMGEHSTLMIHPHSSISAGTHNRLIASLKGDLIEHNRRLQHYVTNSKYETADDVESLLFSTKGDDLWLTPQECLEHGLTDAIATSDKKRKRRKAPAIGAQLLRQPSKGPSGRKRSSKSKR